MLVVCLYQLSILIGLMGFICSIKSIVINKVYMKQSDWKHQQIVDPDNYKYIQSLCIKCYYLNKLIYNYDKVY